MLCYHFLILFHLSECIILDILMNTFNMLFQISLLRKAFVTLVTIVSNIPMCAFDMSVQMMLPRKALVTLITIVSNTLMCTFDTSIQVSFLRTFMNTLDNKICYCLKVWISLR